MEQNFPAAAIIIRDKKVLLLHRIDGLKVWEFPGGKIEFGEHPEEAALREANEETGLEVKSSGLFSIISQVTPQNKHQIWFFYRCEIVSGEPKVNDEDHDKIGWFTMDEIKSMPDLALSVKGVLSELKIFL
jgi:8-oxo-dGTP diphosphatase